MCAADGKTAFRHCWNMTLRTAFIISVHWPLSQSPANGREFQIVSNEQDAVIRYVWNVEGIEWVHTQSMLLTLDRQRRKIWKLQIRCILAFHFPCDPSWIKISSVSLKWINLAIFPRLSDKTVLNLSLFTKRKYWRLRYSSYRSHFVRIRWLGTLDSQSATFHLLLYPIISTNTWKVHKQKNKIFETQVLVSLQLSCNKSAWN